MKAINEIAAKKLTKDLELLNQCYKFNGSNKQNKK